MTWQPPSICGAVRLYPTLKHLHAGEMVDLGGIKFKKIAGDIMPGDLYIAERNTDAELLTCESVENPDGPGNTYVIPTTLHYPYNLSECVRVEEA